MCDDYHKIGVDLPKYNLQQLHSRTLFFVHASHYNSTEAGHSKCSVICAYFLTTTISNPDVISPHQCLPCFHFRGVRHKQAHLPQTFSLIPLLMHQLIYLSNQQLFSYSQSNSGTSGKKRVKKTKLKVYTYTLHFTTIWPMHATTVLHLSF